MTIFNKLIYLFYYTSFNVIKLCGVASVVYQFYKHIFTNLLMGKLHTNTVLQQYPIKTS